LTDSYAIVRHSPATSSGCMQGSYA
jgi:hypothetical protein